MPAACVTNAEISAWGMCSDLGPSTTTFSLCTLCNHSGSPFATLVRDFLPQQFIIPDGLFILPLARVREKGRTRCMYTTGPCLSIRAQRVPQAPPELSSCCVPSPPDERSRQSMSCTYRFLPPSTATYTTTPSCIIPGISVIQRHHLSCDLSGRTLL